MEKKELGIVVEKVGLLRNDLNNFVGQLDDMKDKVVGVTEHYSSMLDDVNELFYQLEGILVDEKVKE